MPDKPQRPLVRPGVVDHQADTPEGTQRMLDQLADAAVRTEPKDRSGAVYDLVVGINRMNTNLGRRAKGANLTPTVASPLFAWSFEADGNERALITILGVDQPACPVEFW